MPLLFGTAQFNEQQHLAIGGCDTTELVATYGSPLIVYDVALMREKARGFKKTLDELGCKNRVVYASKAFCCLAMYRFLQEENLGCDVVSGGELYTALQAGMAPELIEFHGNNKTPAELRFAVEQNVGTIIIDNFYEIECLAQILKELGKTQKIMLRIAPGVAAETHEYISTGQESSKFGFDLVSGQAEKALLAVLANASFEVIGMHCHIGSQIFATEGFVVAIEKMMNVLHQWRETYGYVATCLNIGGGFGVQYTEEDTPLAPADFVHQLATTLIDTCDQLAYPLPELWIEPGRSLVAEAGTTLYTIGAQKNVPDVCHFVSVDGGMGDNIRPALYQAKYDGFLANRQVTDEPTQAMTIVGKYCESGDVLIKDLALPEVHAGELLAITTTGAYSYSMASHYNRNVKPAVVFVEDGRAQLVLRRETYADLISLDC